MLHKNPPVPLHTSQVFFMSELHQLRRKKNRSHKKAIPANSVHHWTRFLEIHNFYNSKIAEAKITAESRKTKQLKDDKSITPKKWWQLAKTIIQKDSANKSSFSPLEFDDENMMTEKRQNLLILFS